MRDTYDPEVYDLFHPVDADDSDIRFFRTLAERGGGPVLELGAGTGRTLLPVARAGVEIHGLDNSDRMLDALRRRVALEPDEVRARIGIERGDMREFDLGRRYALIQIPFRGFLHNVTRDEQLSCLGACRRHLTAGGTLAFSVFHPALEADGFGGPDKDGSAKIWRWRDERNLPEGSFVVLSECRDYDLERQRFSLRLRYERYTAGGALERVHMHCLDLAYLYPRDIERLLTEAGFSAIEIEGGFDGAPLSQEGRELIVTASPRS